MVFVACGFLNFFKKGFKEEAKSALINGDSQIMQVMMATSLFIIPNKKKKGRS
jgi:hypothetical protein